MAAKKAPKASDLLEAIGANQPELLAVSFAASTIYQMKAAEYTGRLCAALAGNTHLTALDLEDCGLNDDCVVELAGALGPESRLASLSLKGNKVKDAGCIALAKVSASQSTQQMYTVLQQDGPNHLGLW